MSILEKAERAIPDRRRFRVEPPSALPGFADIVDFQTNLSYTIFQAEDILDREGWAVLPDGLDANEAWVYPSLSALLRLVWDEIAADARYLVEGY